MLSKDKRQEISCNKWRDAKGRGTLNLIMRFGKTRVAAMIIGKLLKYNPNRTVMAIAPNAETTKNLVNNLGEFCNKDRWLNIMSSNSLINYVNKQKISKKLPIKVDLLILDEVHRLLNGETYEAIKCIEYKFILCLSGSTFNREQVAKLNELGAPIVDKITEIEAVSAGWISNSVEYNLAVELDEDDKVRYAKFSQHIHETLETFNGLYKIVNGVFKNKVFESDFSLVLSAFVGCNYRSNNGNSTFIKPTVIRNILADIMGWKRDMPMDNTYNQRINALWNPDNIYERAKKFKDFVRKRNDILIYNRNKINTVISILKRNSVPTICFNESIAMVDDLANYFPNDGIPYHSAIESRYVINPETGKPYCYKNGEPKLLGKQSLKKLAIEGMRSGKYKYLFTAQSLNEGLTIANIEQVITTGGSCNSNTHGQRVARGKTYDYLNPNKTCTIINLYVDDFELNGNTIISRDKQKLIQRQRDSESVPMWINSIDEIFEKLD